jgi:uncharacterized iron-regulated membrane protein
LRREQPGMRIFRKTLFWIHLIIGVSAGIVVLIMSVTGVLLAYEKQIVAWADTRGYDTRPPAPNATRLPVETLIAKVREAKPDLAISTVTMRSDADATVSVGAGRDEMVYVNAYTGTILGSGSPGVRSFFRSVTDWHRWLAMAGEQRATGRTITGASNFLFMLLVVTGFYLWWPRTWTWQKLRSVTWFKRGLPGKARDFNWHNTIGFWSAVPLFVIVVSGVVMSYPWANAMVYRVVGEEPPAPQQGRGPGGPGGPGGGERRAGGEGRHEGREARGGDGDGAPVATVGLNTLWARAEQEEAAWRTITLRVPNSASAPAMFTIDAGGAGQPQCRMQLTLDGKTGNVVRTESFANYTRGRQLRTFLRFAHTGEYFGVIGQTIAGLVSLGACFLVYTGLGLALRRLIRWWRAEPAPKPVPAVAPAVAGGGVVGMLPAEIAAAQAAMVEIADLRNDPPHIVH